MNMKTYGEIAKGAYTASQYSGWKDAADAVIEEYKRRLWRPVSEPPEDSSANVLVKGGGFTPEVMRFWHHRDDRTHWLRLSDLEPEESHPQDERATESASRPTVEAEGAGSPVGEPAYDKDRDNPFQPTTEGGEHGSRSDDRHDLASEGPTPKAALTPETDTLLGELDRVHRELSKTRNENDSLRRERGLPPTLYRELEDERDALRQRVDALEKELHLGCVNSGCHGERQRLRQRVEHLEQVNSEWLKTAAMQERAMKEQSKRVEELEKMNTELDRFIASHTLPWRRPDEVPTKEELDAKTRWVGLFNDDKGRPYVSTYIGKHPLDLLAWRPFDSLPSWVTEKEDGFEKWWKDIKYPLIDDPKSVARVAYEAGRKKAQS